MIWEPNDLATYSLIPVCDIPEIGICLFSSVSTVTLTLTLSCL